MRVLITGGAGFIGSYLLDELLQTELEVRVCDLQELLHAPMIRPIDFVQGDVTDLELVCEAFTGVDLVIHLVGVRDAHVAERDPDKSFRLNVLALHNVLEGCRLSRVRRIIFPSSAAVYGRTDKVPVSEEDPIRPAGIYAYHKWLCEELLRAYRSTYGVRYTIFRLFNAWGPGNQNIIDHCIQAAKNRHQFTVFGADQLRDFIFIGDVARAFRLAVLSDSLDDRTVNLGSGKGWTIRGVVRIVQNVLRSLEVRFSEKERFTPYHSVADVTLTRSLLGFTAESSETLFMKVIKEMATDAHCS